MWMNEYDVEYAVDHYATYGEAPNLLAAARTLQRLVSWTNSNSDGWPYWRLPSNASKSLQALVDGGTRTNLLVDIDAATLAKALRPVKAFLTRRGVEHSAIIVTA